MRRLFPAQVFAVTALLAACSHRATPLGVEFQDTRVPTPVSNAPKKPDYGDASPPNSGNGIAACRIPSIIDNAVAARTYYLTPAGNDANDGSLASPWASLANVAKLAPGDKVEVADGAYACGAILTAQGSAAAPIWIHAMGNPSSPATPPNAIFRCGAALFGLDIRGARYLAIDGLTIEGGGGVGINIGPGAANSSNAEALADHILINRCAVSETTAAGIRATAATNIDIRNTVVTQASYFGPIAGANGIDLVSVTGATLLGNRVYDLLYTAAVSARAGSMNVLVAGNELYSAIEGIRFGAASPPSDFTGLNAAAAPFEVADGKAVNNLLYGNISAPFVLQGCSACFLTNNTLAVSGVSALVQTLAGGAGRLAQATTSASPNLTIRNNIFEFLSAPAHMYLLLPGDASSLSNGHNLFFTARPGDVNAVASSPPISGPGVILNQDPRFATSKDGQEGYALDATSPALQQGTAAPEAAPSATGECRVGSNLGAF